MPLDPLWALGFLLLWHVSYSANPGSDDQGPSQSNSIQGMIVSSAVQIGLFGPYHYHFGPYLIMIWPKEPYSNSRTDNAIALTGALVIVLLICIIIL